MTGVKKRLSTFITVDVLRACVLSELAPRMRMPARRGAAECVCSVSSSRVVRCRVYPLRTHRVLEAHQCNSSPGGAAMASRFDDMATLLAAVFDV